MENIKQYLKSKEFIVCLLLMSILIIISIIDYIRYPITYKYSGAVVEWMNRFSFWNHTMYYHASGLIMFLSPFIITVLSLSAFFDKVKGSYLKDVLLREKYRSFLTKEILFSYVKTIFPFLFLSLVVFIIGCLFYTDKIVNYTYADLYTEFDYIGHFGPYTYIFLCHIAMFLYIVMVTNLGFIVFRFTKKFSVSLILTFALINTLNFLIGNVDKILKSFLGNHFLVQFLENFNIYEGYMVQSTVTHAIFSMSILVFITTIIVYFLYRNKERLVMDFD